MNRFYRLGNPRSSGQLQSLSHYRDQELQLKQNQAACVTEDGSLLEYEALELRIHPPNVRIDNDNPNHTVLIIDSANRPGTLVEVVQCLTELGLSVKQARISSDGGWFVDEFHVSETPSGRVTDPKKLAAIKKVLSLPEHTGEAVEVHTVFQIAGPETPGLLAEVTQLLSHNGLEIRTAAAWTFNNRAAIVIGVTEQNAAVHDHVKLSRLKQLLTRLVEKTGDNVAVSVEQVEGPVHHERRLHQLLLADEVQAWKQLSRLQRQHSLPFPGPVSIHAPAAADTDAESDQVPSTPQQQWQRKMLPPLWSVDQKGKPIYKEDLRQHLEQQQQQQQQWLAQVHHAAAQQGAAEGPFAASQEHVAVPPSELQRGPAAQVAGSAVEPGTPAQSAAASSAADVQPWPAGSQQPAAPIPIDTAAADKAAAAASAAAAAAQQASVDKLIALLQPQPLMHAISLPPGQKDQQTAATAADTATAAIDRPLRSVSGVPAANGHNSQHIQQQQQPEHPQQSKTAPLPQIVAPGPSDLNPATLGGAAAAAAAGLPPRAPPAHHGPHILPPAQLIIPAAGSEGQGPEPRGHTASISAPTSPSVGPRGGAATAGGFHRVSAAAGGSAAGGGGAGPMGAGVPAWSPRQLASAAAAAGPLSPRALPASSAGGAGAAGGVGVMGLQQQQLAVRQASTPLGSPVSSVLDAPEVQIQHSHLFNYYLVEIHCRDRNKLLFDTVCTLADMRYDIFHATIDSEPCGLATQLFYIRPRFGECVWDERKATELKAILKTAVQRRFPPGLRLHVFSGSTVCLQDLVSSFRRHKLTITRCKVRAYEHASHTFYLLNQDGSLPSRQYVQMACQAAGGELVEAPLDVNNPCVSTVLRSLDARGRFAFSFVNQRSQQRAWAAQTAQQGLMVSGARGVMAPGGPIDISTGVLMSRGDGGVHGGAGRRGVLGLIRGDSSGREVQPEQAKQAGGAASYNSDQQPSF